MVAPILAIADPKSPYFIESDASLNGVGCILSQKQEDDKLHPIAYGGRGLEKAEKNYAATELEALAVHYAAQHFRHFIFGQKVTFITDHSALRWILTTKTASSRLQRWALALMEFDFEVVHRPGKKLSHVDALSRIKERFTRESVEKWNKLEILPFAYALLSENENTQLSAQENSEPVECVSENERKNAKKFVEKQNEDNFIKIMKAYIDKGTLPTDTKVARKIALIQPRFIVKGGATLPPLS